MDSLSQPCIICCPNSVHVKAASLILDRLIRMFGGQLAAKAVMTTVHNFITAPTAIIDGGTDRIKREEIKAVFSDVLHS